MSKKRVAGTIMLHLQDGSKKFLMHTDHEAIDFIMTDFSEEATGLASVLRFFKEQVAIDVNNIQLVELTNVHHHDENIPLFVFETDEQDCNFELAADYFWEDSTKLHSSLAGLEFAGVPYF